MPPHYHVLLNARAGTALGSGINRQDLERVFQEAGLAAVIDDEMQLPLQQRLERARCSDAEVIVAAGGDGTVTAVAAAILGTDKLLAILPLGTVNALARDMGVPAALGEWIGLLEHMEPRRIDVGEVNGQVFLHKVVAGFIPAIAAAREQVRGGGFGAKFAFVLFFFRRLLRSRRVAIEVVNPDGSVTIRRVMALAVSNNQYDEGVGRLFSRSRFDEGTLCIYALRRLGVGDFARLTLEMLLGRWQADEALDIDLVREVTLRTRKKTMKVMLDGEVQSLSVPLRFSIRPLALSILAPSPALAAEQQSAAPAPATV